MSLPAGEPNTDMPTRFRTIKLIAYAVRRRGGQLERQPGDMPTYTLQLPGAEPQGPFVRSELISWANRHLW